MVVARNTSLLQQIQSLKADYPFWGYRRIWAYLRYRMNQVVGKNRIYRLMKKNTLLVCRNLRLKAKRGVHRSKPRASYLNQYWGMDMTKIKFNKGWRYLHVVKDWYNKEIIGWQLSFTSTTDDWLEALDQAVNTRFPWGIHQSETKPNLITDNGCQPMAKAFKQACDALGINQIFTSFNNPKGNADTERLMRTIKEDIVWPYDWENFHDFKEAFKSWVHDYNNEYPHMALGYKTPTQFTQNTLLFAA